jgi:hypothetical protein
MAIVETANNNPLIRRRKDRFANMLTQKSCVKSIAPQDTIWTSVKLCLDCKKMLAQPATHELH